MRLFLIVASVLLGLAQPAFAQLPRALAQTSAETTMRGLEAQYQAAMIRSRRLADDRESRLIADYEMQLRNARVLLDRHTADAQAELDRARAQFSNYVEQVALRDASSRAEIETYRAELRGLIQRSSPELLAAYQRFADGDRIGAWPVIDALTQAQVRVTLAAANVRAAAQLRDAARARETMRLHGEASAADVLALWDQAAALDPNDFPTHENRRRLSMALNDLSRAEAASRDSLSSATSPVERVEALIGAGDVNLARNDSMAAFHSYRDGYQEVLPLVRTDFDSLRLLNDLLERFSRVRVRGILASDAAREIREAVEVVGLAVQGARSEAESDRGNMYLRYVLAERLTILGDVLLATQLMDLGDLSAASEDTRGALNCFEEVTEIAAAALLVEPANVEMRRLLRDGELRASRANGLLGGPGTQSHLQEALRQARMIVSARPGDAEDDLAVFRILNSIGDLASYRESVIIARRLVAADPSDRDRASDLMWSLYGAGSALRESDRPDEALVFLREALQIAERLSQEDLTNADRARAVRWAMVQLANIPESGVRWADVVRYMEDLQARGLLMPEGELYLRGYRSRASVEDNTQ